MSESFDRSMAFTEHWEGGFSSDPADAGGNTIYGISYAAHPDPGFWNNPTPAKARAIYKQQYWSANKLHLLPPHVAVVAFDLFVNHSPKAAVKILQRGAGRLKIDGSMGPATRARLRENISISDIIQRRIEYYGFLVRRNGSQERFITGWQRRATALGLYSLGVQAGINVKPDGRYSA